MSSRITLANLAAGLEIEHRETKQRARVDRVNRVSRDAFIRVHTIPASRATRLPFARLARDWKVCTTLDAGSHALHARPSTKKAGSVAASASDMAQPAAAGAVAWPLPPEALFVRFLTERVSGARDAADHSPFITESNGATSVQFRIQHWLDWLREQGVSGPTRALTAPLFAVGPIGRGPRWTRRSVQLTDGTQKSTLIGPLPPGCEHLPVRGRLHGGGFKAPDAPSDDIARTVGHCVLAIETLLKGMTPVELRYAKSRITRVLRDIPNTKETP